MNTTCSLPRNAINEDSSPAQGQMQYCKDLSLTQATKSLAKYITLGLGSEAFSYFVPSFPIQPSLLEPCSHNKLPPVRLPSLPYPCSRLSAAIQYAQPLGPLFPT